MAKPITKLSLPLRPKDIERFWSRVDRRGDDECWPWLRALSHGYGAFHVQNKQMKANRLSLILATGENPQLLAAHHCDNRSCCNPKHLYWGTYSQNMEDVVARYPGYEEHAKRRGKSRRKLLDSQVAYIKRLVGEGFSDGLVAGWYGVSAETIRNIRKGWISAEVEPATLILIAGAKRHFEKEAKTYALTMAQVDEIRSLASLSYADAEELGARFGCCGMTVMNAWTGKYRKKKGAEAPSAAITPAGPLSEACPGKVGVALGH